MILFRRTKDNTSPFSLNHKGQYKEIYARITEENGEEEKRNFGQNLWMLEVKKASFCVGFGPDMEWIESSEIPQNPSGNYATFLPEDVTEYILVSSI